MLEKTLSFLRKNALLLGCLLAVYITVTVLFVYGHFNDLAVAHDVYDPSGFLARHIASLGTLPLYLTMFVIGTMVAFLRVSEKLYAKIIQWVLAAVLFGVGLYMGGDSLISEQSGYGLAAAIVIIGIAAIATAVLTYFFIKNIPSKTLLRAAIVLTLITGIAVLLVEVVVKGNWARPRPYLIFMLESDEYFLPWFMPGAGSDIRALLDAETLGVESLSDYFKSFPSGHTAYATLLLSTSTVMLSIKPKTRKFAFLGVIVGGLYAFITAYGRIQLGAHYLTDTMAGYSIVFLLFLMIGLPFCLKRQEDCPKEAPLK